MGIKEQIQALREDPLREKIVIPLLKALGCERIRDMCSSNEKGKDIIYVNRNHFLRREIYGAVVLKVKKIDKSKELPSLQSQITQSLWSFPNPDDPINKIRVHEVLVITSKTITADAQEYIIEESGKNFPCMHFVDGVRLEFLIQTVVNEYNQKNRGKNIENYIFDTETFAEVIGDTSNF